MKLTIILPGGGIKGAFQLSVLKTIFENAKHNDIIIDKIYGTSVGAIIAPFVLTKRFYLAMDFLKNLKSINDISNSWDYSNIPIIGTLINYYNLYFKKSYFKSINLSILDELEDLLSDEEIKIIYNKLHCCAFNMTKGREELLIGEKWKKNIEASASLWTVYPPIKINNYYYTDGGLTERIPITDLLNINDSIDHNILIINFKKDLESVDECNLDSMNILEYCNHIIGLSGEKHVIEDYKNMLKIINKDKVHMISMETKFKNSLEFNQLTIKQAINEGEEKGLEWYKKMFTPSKI